MKCITLLTSIVTVIPAMAYAQDTVNTGVPACDAFIAAYRQCIASPGVPAGIRPNLTQALDQMATTYRDLAAGPARRSVGGSCVQAHTATRTSLVQSFKCDFPAADERLAQAAVTTPAADPAPAASPSRGSSTTTSTAEAVMLKENAYVQAYNRLVQFHNISQDLSQYLSSNERMLKPNAKVDGNSFFLFGITDFGSDIEALEKATSMPSPMPDVDAADKKLLEALNTLNPLVLGLKRYQEARDFREDNYKYARAQTPAFVKAMEAADEAADSLSDALDEREMTRQQAKIATAPEGSPRRLMMTVALDARRASRVLQSAGQPGGPAKFEQSIATVAADNRALAAAMDTLRPKPDDACMRYVIELNSLIGYGRDLVRDLKSGGRPNQAAEGFVRTFNNSVGYLPDCQNEDERFTP